jgi:hypothetical protein
MRKIRTLVVALSLFGLVSVMAVPAAFAGGADLTDSFVCPVLGGQAGGDHGNSAPSPILTIPSGSSSVLGPDVSVPLHATNDDGAGNPADHVSPGDANYSPIWSNLSGPPGAP